MIACTNRLKHFFGFLLLATLLVAAGSIRAEQGYTFAVVPQFEQRKLYAIWKPIVDEVAKRSGIRLKLVATLTVQEFERELAKGSFDFTYTNPYQILRESKHQGYIPLLRDNVPLTGILVVARDSPVRSVAELNGKTLAVPSPNSLGASLLLRADLEQIHQVRMKMLNVNTHSSVYLNVANGLADAGGGVQKTLAEQDDNIRNALRIIYTTRNMPSHPVSAHPRVPKHVRGALRKALLDMVTTAGGRALLAEVPMTQPVAASIDDYLPMQEWGLEKYWVEKAR
ncbi:MAG: phosphate/phosphite/phosphonate ABC transporter substrate-binding protein [Sulfuritalea sp.]|nr:phosphate/phosphite/phosphonate ABC transporter substrate-binding protein [Sulfuritalea sp.]